MAGLIDLIKKGKFSKTDNVLFMATGGQPALFAYDHYFSTANKTQFIDKRVKA